MSVKQTLLNNILQAEEKEANFGAKAAALRREYIQKFAPIRQGDLVFFGKYGSEAMIPGVVKMVKYNNGDFLYKVAECKKDWEQRKRRDYIWIKKNDSIKLK